VGLPKSVQSDQGSSFMSGKSYVSWASVPSSVPGGSGKIPLDLEKHNESVLLEENKDWNEGVHLLLFAVTESGERSYQ